MSPVAISPRDTATFAADLAETRYVDDATLVAQGIPTPGEPPPGETRRHPSQVQPRAQNQSTRGTRPVLHGREGTLAAPKSLLPATQTRR